MKKLILLSALVLTCAGCGPDWEDIYYSSTWSVKNSTEQTLTISPAPRGGTDPYTLAAGEEIEFYSRGEYKYSSYFEMIMVCWRGVPEAEIYFDISDTDGTLLKRWQYKKDTYYQAVSGGCFFNSYSWTHSSDDKRKKKKDRWSFEILPEDVQ